MVKMHIALSKKTKMPKGIDEVKRGKACNCICISCKANLIAKKSEHKQRDWHFAHNTGATKECDYSFWVACRDLALQTLQKRRSKLYDNHIVFKIPKIHILPPWRKPIKTLAPFKINNLSANNVVHDGNRFDAKIETIFGNIYVYFVTPKEDSNRHRSHSETKNIYFYDTLILEINLTLALYEKHSISKFLEEIIFNTSTCKSWFLPKVSFLPEEEIILPIVDVKASDCPVAPLRPMVFQLPLSPKINFEIDLFIDSVTKLILPSKLSNTDKLAISFIADFFELASDFFHDKHAYGYYEIFHYQSHFLLNLNNQYYGVVMVANGYTIYQKVNQCFLPRKYINFYDNFERALRNMKNR